MARKILKRTESKLAGRVRRKKRVRRNIWGTAECPRFCVTKTNTTLIAQLINDDLGATLVGMRGAFGKSINCDVAKDLGKKVATQAQSKGIKAVVFDRSGFSYHGRIKALAEGAREGGLKF